MDHLNRNLSLEQLVENYYSPMLPYHNFGHILNVLEAAEHIASRCDTAGVKVNWEIVYYALLFHDAGYIEDHKEKGFETKEAYSAAIAEKELMSRGVDKKIIEKVSQTILSTERNAKFSTNEEKVVRAADLSEIASDFEVFRNNTENLKKEEEMLTGEAISWDEWLQRVSKTIEFYLTQHIHITSAKDQDDSYFHDQARKNLAELKKKYSSAA